MLYKIELIGVNWAKMISFIFLFNITFSSIPYYYFPGVSGSVQSLNFVLIGFHQFSYFQTFLDFTQASFAVLTIRKSIKKSLHRNERTHKKCTHCILMINDKNSH